MTSPLALQGAGKSGIPHHTYQTCSPYIQRRREDADPLPAARPRARLGAGRGGGAEENRRILHPPPRLPYAPESRARTLFVSPADFLALRSPRGTCRHPAPACTSGPAGRVRLSSPGLLGSGVYRLSRRVQVARRRGKGTRRAKAPTAVSALSFVSQSPEALPPWTTRRAALSSFLLCGQVGGPTGSAQRGAGPPAGLTERVV